MGEQEPTTIERKLNLVEIKQKLVQLAELIVTFRDNHQDLDVTQSKELDIIQGNLEDIREMLM